MSTFENLRSLSQLPASEHLKARRTSKLQFLDLEKRQLLDYRSFLQQNLSCYKEMIRDCLSVHSETRPIESMSQMLGTQNERLDRFLCKLISERDEALEKERRSHEECLRIQTNEETLIKHYGEQLQLLLSQAELREKTIQDLEIENSRLETKKDVVPMQAVLTEKEKKDLLVKKEKVIKSMIIKINHLSASVSEGNLFLSEKLEFLDSHYDKVNSMLKDPEIKNYDINEIKLPCKNTTVDEFWKANDDSKTPEMPVHSDCSYQGKQKAMESKLKQCEETQNEYYVKIQAILHEINTAEALRDQLLMEQNHLEELARNSNQKQASLDELKQETLNNNKRCNSNPLDYADQKELFQLEDESKPLKNKLSQPSEDEYDYDVDISNIIDSQMNSELCVDSLIMDIFNISQNS